MGAAFSASGKVEYATQSVFNGLTKLSVSYWLRVTAAASYEYFVHQRDDVDPKYGFGVTTDYGGTQATLRVAPSNYSTASANSQITASWQQFLWVYDGTQALQANRGLLYRGGAAQTLAVTDLDATSVGTTTVPLTLSGNGYVLAEVGIWPGVAITDATAISRLAAGWYPADAGVGGLAYYWSLLADTTETVAGLGAGTASGTVSVSAEDHPTMVQVVGRRPWMRVVGLPRPGVARRTV